MRLSPLALLSLLRTHRFGGDDMLKRRGYKNKASEVSKMGAFNLYAPKT